MSIESIGTSERVPAQEALIGLPENKRDREAEREILECFSRKTIDFSRIIHYSYGFRSYSIEISFDYDNHFVVYFLEAPSQKLQDHLVHLVKKNFNEDLFKIQVENTADSDLTKIDISKIKMDEPDLTQFDSSSDRHIEECLRSSKYSKLTICYNYGDDLYDIVIVNNPAKAPLLGQALSVPSYYPFVFVSQRVLPQPLQAHLMNLIPAELKNAQAPFIDLDGSNRLKYNHLRDLEPVAMIPDAKIDAYDAQIQAAFKSREFVNKVFIYKMNGKEYRIRIIHNPHQAPLTWNRLFFGTDGIQWTGKYYIVSNKEAPQELINHLKGQLDLWNRFFHCKVLNGSEYILDGGIRSRLTYFDHWAHLTN